MLSEKQKIQLEKLHSWMKTKEGWNKMSNRRKGKPLSNIWKQKIGVAMRKPEMKKKMKELAKKYLSEHPEELERLRKLRKGCYPSEGTRRKMSKKKMGEGSPNWKGGITTDNERIKKGLEFKLWREAVFSRDDWTCQGCGQHGDELHPHHIFNFATYIDRRFDITNGITLCKNCHLIFHKSYGYKNNTREQLNEFLQK